MSIDLRKILFTVFFIAAIIMVIILISLTSIQNRNKPSTVPTLTPVPTPSGLINSHIKYDPNAQTRLNEDILNKNNFSPSDLTARQNIINILSGKTGTLYTSLNVKIFYLSSVGLFEGEILTTNIDSAKKEAMDWFKSRGLSQEGVCNLPLMFYLGGNAINQFDNQNIIFSPLPPGC
jgi:hypothetical protein